MKNCEYLGKGISSPLMLGGRYTPRQWSCYSWNEGAVAYKKNIFHCVHPPHAGQISLAVDSKQYLYISGRVVDQFHIKTLDFEQHDTGLTPTHCNILGPL